MNIDGHEPPKTHLFDQGFQFCNGRHSLAPLTGVEADVTCRSCIAKLAKRRRRLAKDS